jgi:hypothetical protein
MHRAPTMDALALVAGLLRPALCWFTSKQATNVVNPSIK